MPIDQSHIAQIRDAFTRVQTKEDLVSLLNTAQNMMYGKECKPILLRSLTYYANPALCTKRYHTFTIKKKSGGHRVIHAPVSGLKSILRALNFIFQCMAEPHHAATGFILNKSIVDNASKHVGHNYVYDLDLKDFFHAFDRSRVKLIFKQAPFNLKEDKEPIAFFLACLCTHPIQMDGEQRTVLPQGSPTSPTLTNLLCKTLDRRLNGLAKRFGAVYTRYADDITFSSPHNIYHMSEFIDELNRIIVVDQKLIINSNKTRLQKAGYRQEATGLLVNEKVNVQRRYVKQIRMWLYYWEKYGYEKTAQVFNRDYQDDKGVGKPRNVNMAKVLEGKLEFLRMVKGTEDSTCNLLRLRFDKLSKIKKSKASAEIDLESVLNLLQTKGLENALDLFESYKKE